MSTIDIFSRANIAQGADLRGVFSKIVARVRRYNSYRRTLIELENLTDRELADLGLVRHQIRSVAFREAYES